MKQTNDLLVVRRFQLNQPSIGGTPVLAARLARRHRRPLGADPRAFLAACFGRKSGAGDLPGYSGSLVFRTPGGAHQAITHTWLVQPTLAFTINQLFQHFEFWLQQTATTQLIAASVRPTLLGGSPSNTGLPFLRTMAEHESRVALQSHERRLQSFFRDPSAQQLPAAPGQAGERGPYATQPTFRWVTLAAGGRRDAGPLARPGRPAFDRPADSVTVRSTQVRMGERPGPFLAGIRELWQPTPLLDRQWFAKSIRMMDKVGSGRLPQTSQILQRDRTGHSADTIIGGAPPNFQWVTLAARRTAAGAQPAERVRPGWEVPAVVTAGAVDARLTTGLTPQHRALIAHLPIMARFVQLMSMIHEQRRPSLAPNRLWAVGGAGSDSVASFRGLEQVFLTPAWRWLARQPAADLAEARARFFPIGAELAMLSSRLRSSNDPLARPSAPMVENSSIAQLMSGLETHLIREVSAARQQSTGEAAFRSFDPTPRGWRTLAPPLVAPLRREQPAIGAMRMWILGQTPAMNALLPLLAGYRFSHGALGMAGPDPILVRRAAYVAGGDVDQHERGRSELTFVHREERFEAPALHYVFVQPAQPTVEEQQVIKTVREKEVVEIVKKEVQTIMSSGTAVKLLQADYAQIADRVHFSLARQLLTEKERRGL